MSRTLRRWVGLAALIALLAVPLAFVLSQVFGGVVEELVTTPFLYLAWIGRLYLRTVPRILFWGGLLVFGLGLAAASILIPSMRRGRAEGGGGRRDERGADQLGAIRQLASRIRFAARSPYFRERLAQRMSVLALQIFDERDAGRRGEIERVLDELDAPPEVRAFFREGEGLAAQPSRGGLIFRLRQLVRGPGGRDARYDALEHAVHWLEDQMEGA